MHNNVESNTDSSSHKCGDFHFINSLTQNWSIIVSHDTSPNHCPQPHPTRTFLDSLNESSNTHWLTRLTVSIYYYYPSRDARVAGHITILKIIIKKRIKLSPFKNPLWNPKSYSTWLSLKYVQKAVISRSIIEIALLFHCNFLKSGWPDLGGKSVRQLRKRWTDWQTYSYLYKLR